MVRKCTLCGFNNRDDANYCSNCGSPLAMPTVPMAPPMPTVPMAPPTVKPVPSVRVVSPVAPPPMAPLRVPSPGMCFYHSNLPAAYICSRCGRPICRDCARFYGDLILCPQCYAGIIPIAPVPAAAPPPVPALPPMAPPPAPPYLVPVAPARAVWGFIISLIAGIMIMLNAGALLSLDFYNWWVTIFPWVQTISPWPPWTAFVIGVVLGLIAVIGSLLMIMGYGTMGSIAVFPAAIISLVIGGGFIAGFILGIIGGILGMLGR
ncbi:MAG: zinc-ribbon domain-containing protein [Candidatus Bathyarchaeia archaeon]